jgi:hypothetical protein
MVSDRFLNVDRGSVNSGYCDAVFSARSKTGLVLSPCGVQPLPPVIPRSEATRGIQNPHQPLLLSRERKDETTD